MKILYEIIRNEKSSGNRPAEHGMLTPSSAARQVQPINNHATAAEPEADSSETGRWVIPALLAVLLTAGSFYYYQQKVENQARLEREAARAEVRRDYPVVPELNETRMAER